MMLPVLGAVEGIDTRLNSIAVLEQPIYRYSEVLRRARIMLRHDRILLFPASTNSSGL